MDEQHTGNAPDLPDLSDEAIQRLERGVFEEIGRDRSQRRRRGRVRRRWTVGALGAVAAAAVGIVVVPMIGQSVGDVSGVPQYSADEAGPDSAGDTAVESTESTGGSSSSGGALAPDFSEVDRKVIRVGSATVVVDDVSAASDALNDLADELGGYVDGLGADGGEDDGGPTHGWVTIRIPSNELDDARVTLSDLGDVTRTEVTQDDVTSQAIDLRARVDSLEASVRRLTELMAKAGSVGDLLEAEQALSQRQADLESYQRELERLDDQVAMSTLSVDLVRADEAVPADPAGFGDGFLSGWNGLIAFVNGLVIAAGFLIPWVGVVAAAALVVWLVFRLVRRRRAAD